MAVLKAAALVDPVGLCGRFVHLVHIDFGLDPDTLGDPEEEHYVGLASETEVAGLYNLHFQVVAAFALSIHSVVDGHLCLIAADSAGHTVDLADYNHRGARSHSPRLTCHIHWAAAHSHLVACNLACHDLGQGSRDHTVRSHSRFQCRRRRSTVPVAGSCRRLGHHILHTDVAVARSLGRRTGHSCHIAAAEGSRRSVSAPGPAGAAAGRNRLAEELRM